MTTNNTLMSAEVLFLDPRDVEPTEARLRELGFDIERLDWTDPYGPTVWINASTRTELDQSGFLDHVQSIVEPLGGDVVEAGIAERKSS